MDKTHELGPMETASAVIAFVCVERAIESIMAIGVIGGGYPALLKAIEAVDPDDPPKTVKAYVGPDKELFDTPVARQRLNKEQKIRVVKLMARWHDELEAESKLYEEKKRELESRN